MYTEKILQDIELLFINLDLKNANKKINLKLI